MLLPARKTHAAMTAANNNAINVSIEFSFG